ncbi:MAG TPA: RluA family pseudouridine synthase [Burkholderiales bacterium]|jgi:23S rRNA pseudouridine955/2504/2580 synthase|nr:RluA family pseudouridine synthase [Burkholderiales bacterium]
MNGLSKGSVTWTEVDESSDQQRIDNFLLRTLKGVPKSHVYRILRSGEVRVNSHRVDAAYRLQVGDRIRIPPVRKGEPGKTVAVSRSLPPLAARALLEDDWLLAIDKPAGVAAHGGSGVSLGVIERLRLERPQLRFLELVHRLDRDTSGVLLLAKKRSALTALHAQLRQGGVEKRYLVLVVGRWNERSRSVALPLKKYLTRSGERRVVVDQSGMAAHTVFRLLSQWRGFSLLEAQLKTGRMHQIRVHLSHLGFPIVGDDKYGDFTVNRELSHTGVKRMFLHAARIVFRHPDSGQRVRIDSPLPADLQAFIDHLEAKGVAAPDNG